VLMTCRFIYDNTGGATHRVELRLLHARKILMVPLWKYWDAGIAGSEGFASTQRRTWCAPERVPSEEPINFAMGPPIWGVSYIFFRFLIR